MGNFIINLFVYFVYYVIQKVYYNETISKIWIVLLLISIIFMIVSVIFYNISVTNKLLSPSESDKLNKPCVIFDYFDYHDVWHILSSTGLFFMMINIYRIDCKLDNIKRSEINIF